ncbi:DUF4247 domain-containing protein [Paenibacillus sp. 1001270B_150601_E10]|uniref:DUF4247 domain-containing protein n=1 Tax=Paenibacillus sp. 1001270B_150601_E10 TaxID=2787079 RepID=UPI0018A112E0|nr:DUF4247 domain-containing protein [Paenibacillus sp. 1001270B_150601_E10]
MTIKKNSFYWIKCLLVLTLIFPLLAACGQVNVAEQFPLESVTEDGNRTSYVYRAADTTVPDAAKLLSDKQRPEQISKEDPERMFLVYSNQIIQIQQDQEQPKDALIEVASKEYVKQNYDRSFLEMYLTYKIVDSMFDSLSGLGKYRGYTDRKVYTPSKPYHAPTKEDMKKAPPITVDRKGSIFKRGSSNDSTVGSSSNIFKRTPSSSKGTISRDKSGTSIKNPTIKKYKPPKTRSGKGSVFRRGRR